MLVRASLHSAVVDLPHKHPAMSMTGSSGSTHLVRQDQAQLQRTIGNIGVTSSSDSGSGSEGGSGGGEEHDRQVVSTSFERYSKLFDREQ
jgi:hypothetical protein